jgi:hypothetical protein
MVSASTFDTERKLGAQFRNFWVNWRIWLESSNSCKLLFTQCWVVRNSFEKIKIINRFCLYSSYTQHVKFRKDLKCDILSWNEFSYNFLRKALRAHTDISVFIYFNVQKLPCKIRHWIIRHLCYYQSLKYLVVWIVISCRNWVIKNDSGSCKRCIIDICAIQYVNQGDYLLSDKEM